MKTTMTRAKSLYPGTSCEPDLFHRERDRPNLDERMKPFFELARGDYFGDESLFNEQSRCYAAIAKADSLFLTLSRSHLLSIISECPSVAVALLQAYSQQIPCRHKTGALV